MGLDAQIDVQIRFFQSSCAIGMNCKQKGAKIVSYGAKQTYKNSIHFPSFSTRAYISGLG